MIRSYLRDANGGAALAFAILAPASVSLIFGAAALGMAAWNKNILQEVAYETARCVATSGAACTSACVGAAPGVCFAQSRAADRGLPNLDANNVSLNANAVISGSAFTTVSITYQFRLAGFAMPLVGYAAFPNGG